MNEWIMRRFRLMRALSWLARNTHSKIFMQPTDGSIWPCSACPECVRARRARIIDGVKHDYRCRDEGTPLYYDGETMTSNDEV